MSLLKSVNDTIVYFTPEKRDAHESCHPEVTIHEEIMGRVAADKSLYNARHQVANDDQVADTHTKTFDRDGGIEDDGSIRVGQLRQRKERGTASIQILGTSRLQVQTKSSRESRPQNHADSENDSHVRNG